MKLYAGFRADRKIEITEQFIQIVPTCRATSSIIDREKDKQHYRIECWEGTKRYSKCFPYKNRTKEEAFKDANTYLKSFSLNTTNSVLDCQVSELTPVILQKFR